MRLPAILLLAIGLALSPAPSSRGQDSPEVSREIIDALLVLAASPEVDTVKLMEIALDMFPGQDIHQILDSLLDDTLPDYTETPAFAGPTGFEETGVALTGFDLVDHTAPQFEETGVALTGFDLVDHTAPQFEVTVLMAVLSEAARRIALVDDSDRMAAVYRAAGGIELPKLFRRSALGMRWHDAVEAQDYETMAEIAGKIRRRQANFPRTRQQEQQ